MPWIKKEFHHSASSPNDPFRLKCWVKVNGAEYVDRMGPDDFLPFDQFDSKVWMPQYTREEYDAFLASDDWSFEETNYLIQLCELFALKFFVIADRYEFQANDTVKRRSIEDIKERYYFVCNKLEKLKGPPPASQVPDWPASFRYSKQEEVERKKELEKLYTRNQEQIIEEAFLSQQLVSMLHSYDQIMHDREAAIRLHIGDVFLNRFVNVPHKEVLGPKSAGIEDAASRSSYKKKASGRPVPSSGEVRTPSEAYPRQPTATGSTVHLRSSKLHPVRVAYVKQVDKFLTEHSISSKPAYATEELCALYDELRQLIANTFELKRSSSSTFGNPEKRHKPAVL